MKILFFALIFVTVSFQNVFSQKVGDDFPVFDKVPDTFFDTRNLENKISILESNLTNPRSYKKNQKYDKVIYKDDNKSLWFSGRFAEQLNYGYWFKDISPIKYLSNDQLYNTYEKVSKGGLNYDISTIFHENGKIKQQSLYYYDARSQIERVYDENGLLVREYSSEYASSRKHPYAGVIQQFTVSPMTGAPPNYHTYKNGNSYLGYQYIGTLYTTDHLQITGLFATLEYAKGNGGVFFVENTISGQCSWITVVNRKIIALKNADISEKPDIHKLNKEMVAQEYRWVIYDLSKKDKKTLGVDPEDMKLDLTLGIDYIEISSSNDPVLNGYHFKITPITNSFLNDGLMITCGNYINGKLEGMGFSTRIDRATNKAAMGPSTRSMVYMYGKWDMQAGHFVNNSYITGTQFKTSNYYHSENGDIFTRTGIPYFEYINKPYNVRDDESLSIAKITVGKSIYVYELGRYLVITAVDHNKGTITTNTDVVGKPHTFEVNKNKLYFYVPSYKPYTYQCDKTVQKPIYKHKQVLLYHEFGDIKTSSYTVKGVYVDKKVTTTTVTQGKPVYGTKSEVERYETVPCPKCAGRGYLTATKDEGQLVRVKL